MQTIGIDIGGTKIRAVLRNGKRVLAARQAKTPKTLIGFQKAIVQLITWRRTAKPPQVGIGAAGIISGTKIVFSPNIKYLKNHARSAGGFDLKSLLSNRIAKLKVDNDARCFARAEFAVGSADGRLLKNNQSILFLTLGTGIGRAMVKNGKVLRIKKFEYPETWEKEYQKIRGGVKKKMDDKFAQFLALKLLPILKKYKPETIVFGGGVAERSGFLDTMKRQFYRYALSYRISVSKFGKDTVAIGAAMLFR